MGREDDSQEERTRQHEGACKYRTDPPSDFHPWYLMSFRPEEVEEERGSKDKSHENTCEDIVAERAD